MKKILNRKWLMLIGIILGIICTLAITIVCRKKIENKQVRSVNYYEFIDMLKAEDRSAITEIEYDPNSLEIKFIQNEEVFFTKAPSDEIEQSILLVQHSERVPYLNVKINSNTFIKTIVEVCIPVFLILAFYFFMFRYGVKGLGMFEEGDEDQIDADVTEDKTITFSDVVGNNEIKQELLEYVKDNAETPAILFYGPPGTGKSYLARGFCGELKGGKFYSLSGSDILSSKYMGVGVKKIKTLFKKAKANVKNGKCVVFIDEIDSIGMRRTSEDANSSAGKDNRATLNALLVQMDKAKEEGIIVIASTNTENVLDPALLRRFTRQFQFCRLSPEEGCSMFKYFVQKNNILLSDELQDEKIIKKLGECTPSEIESLIMHVKTKMNVLKRDTLDEQLFSMCIAELELGGALLDDSKCEEKEKITIAYHEAGHAILSMIQNKEVDMISINGCTSGELGFVSSNTTAASYLNLNEVMQAIRVLYAGYLTECLVLEKRDKIDKEDVKNFVSFGCWDDIKNVTDLVKQYFPFIDSLSDGVLIDSGEGKGDDMVTRVFLFSRMNETREILENNWGKIEKLKQALLESKSGSLSGAEVNCLLN